MPEIEDYHRMLEEIDDGDASLSPWEVNFVSDLLGRFENFGVETRLSGKQQMKIEQIWSKTHGR
ncbi:MAG: hypothetical protein ACE5FA_00240 [Dehalococcoidia bacterium]